MSNVKFLASSVANMFSINNEKGVTAIESGLIASLIALAIIAAVTLVGQKLANDFGNIANHL